MTKLRREFPLQDWGITQAKKPNTNTRRGRDGDCAANWGGTTSDSLVLMGRTGVFV